MFDLFIKYVIISLVFEPKNFSVCGFAGKVFPENIFVSVCANPRQCASAGGFNSSDGSHLGSKSQSVGVSGCCCATVNPAFGVFLYF